ncbi:hypothetical protein [Sphingobium sp.]|uniref:hypothetical protein n=1 Tax=Sphingobium sp. TaxID=1912891 RepID=UPI0026327E3C|nr:hypothetical protein [Sphingobium sp.]
MGAAAQQVTFNVPPFTFNRDAALRYTGLAPTLFERLEREGSITGKRVGRHGEVVYLRDQLEKVTAALFGGSTSDIDDEFEGLGG